MVSNSNPLRTWGVTIITVGVSFFFWLVFEPVRLNMLDAMAGGLPHQALSPLNTLNVLWFGTPIIISVMIVVWAFLTTTKHQVLVNPEYDY